MKPCEIGTIESTDSTEIDVEEEEISNSVMLDEMLENIAKEKSNRYKTELL